MYPRLLGPVLKWRQAVWVWANVIKVSAYADLYPNLNSSMSSKIRYNLNIVNKSGHRKQKKRAAYYRPLD